MKAPTFSICIPNYNYGKYIGDTIQSVLDQTYPHFEIIVADNASTDDSIRVVKSFKDERIRLVQNKYNIGFAPNLQQATMYARNEFVNLLSSDDQMKPDALEVYARVLGEMGEDSSRTVLYSAVESFDNDERVSGYIVKANDGFYSHSVKGDFANSLRVQDPDDLRYFVFEGRDVLRDSLRRLKSFAAFLSIVYPRTMWESVEGYNSVRTIGPDKHFNYKLLSLDPKVVYVPRILYRYRDFQSANRSAQTTTLKQPIDDYLYTIEYSEEHLNSLGLSRDILIHTFLDRVCLKEGLRQLGRGKYKHAFQLLAFALSSYPGKALRMPKSYALMSLLGLGPLTMLVSPLLYAAYRRLHPEPTIESRGLAGHTL